MIAIFSNHLKGDKIIWIVIFILFVVSMLAVYSSTGTLAYQYRGGNTTFYLFRHAIFLILGIGIIYITHRMSYLVFSRMSQIFFLLSIILLLFTLLLGNTKNDATRWLTVPGLGIAFQTSDFAKFSLIIYVARILSVHQEKPRQMGVALKQIAFATIITCGFIAPENLSTAALLFFTVMVLMYIGRMPMKYIYYCVGLITIVLIILVTIAFVSPDLGRFGTWKNRIENYVSGDDDANYQADQAKIAIATGGFFGKRPGNSTQRNFLPFPYSDFIYAIIVEEYGFVGGFTIILLYLFLLYRSGVIVKKCNRTFPALLTVGLTFSLVFQALINMGVAVSLLPVTGQPLPFVSMGGTSILFTSMALGIILSVSRHVEANKETVNIKEEV
jgi:cell division protein FtsW